MHLKPGRPKPYEAGVTSRGKTTSLGSFATAEEAALCAARSPEGQQAAMALAAVAERAVAVHRAAERALAALGKGKKRRLMRASRWLFISRFGNEM